MPRVRRVIRPIRCARHVKSSLRLVVRELIGKPGVGRYNMRASGLAVHLRQPHVDVWMLDEIFQLGGYAIPPAVARALSELDRPVRILDLGSCVGLATLFFLEIFPDALITGFEPDPANREVLLQTIDENEMGERWTVVGAGASNRDGSAPFISDHFLSHVDRDSSGDASITVPTLDVFSYLANADLVKMDIQGGEWDILEDPRFAATAATAIVVEYHPYLSPSSDAHRAAQNLLHAAGYTTAPVGNEHDGEGTIWGWRPGRPTSG